MSTIFPSFLVYQRIMTKKACCLVLIILGLICSHELGIASQNISGSSVGIEKDMGRKNEGHAVLWALLPFGLGHYYAGDWGRGVAFVLGEIVAASIAAAGVIEDSQPLIIAGQNAFYGIKAWELIDASRTAAKRNAEIALPPTEPLGFDRIRAALALTSYSASRLPPLKDGLHFWTYSFGLPLHMETRLDFIDAVLRIKPSYITSELEWAVDTGIDLSMRFHPRSRKVVPFISLGPSLLYNRFRIDDVHRGIFDDYQVGVVTDITKLAGANFGAGLRFSERDFEFTGSLEYQYLLFGDSVSEIEIPRGAPIEREEGGVEMQKLILSLRGDVALSKSMAIRYGIDMLVETRRYDGFSYDSSILDHLTEYGFDFIATRLGIVWVF